MEHLNTVYKQMVQLTLIPYYQQSLCIHFVNLPILRCNMRVAPYNKSVNTIRFNCSAPGSRKDYHKRCNHHNPQLTSVYNYTILLSLSLVTELPPKTQSSSICIKPRYISRIVFFNSAQTKPSIQTYTIYIH